MIRSMTGYGDAERDTPAGRLRAELKTVNHRFFSANLRLPSSLERFEPQAREWLRSLLPRGHVSFSLRLETQGADADDARMTLDVARARQYLAVLSSLKQQLNLPGEVDVALLSRFGDLIVHDDSAEIVVAAQDVQAVIESAARAAVEMREIEGTKLRADLEGRLDAIEVEMRVIGDRAPERLVNERDRLRRAIEELVGDVGVDEDRVVREVAFMAERWDISEEIVRMRSHIELFRQTLDGESAEPVGKRLGFLIQEMHREANTIGSKANDALVEHRVIAIKDEIERLREQIENVE
jgi:uncharacterized protein (TIGR00255 family)